MSIALSIAKTDSECTVPVRNARTADPGMASVAAFQDVIDKLKIAIAVFDTDQRLINNNARYACLWRLPQDWLDTHPSFSDILDRLRESRLLPEQRDFAGWKKLSLELFAGGRHSENFWHMPNGRSLRIVSEFHLQGGFFVTYEDVSEVFGLKAANTALAAVQKATLDTIDDAVAVFDPDGRLTHANQSFSDLWNLSAMELANEPHFKEIAEHWSRKSGGDGIWDIVSAAVASENPESYREWGYLTRADGREIHLTPTRLPNGATLVTFRDMTDLMRFESLQLEPEYDHA